MEFFCFHLMPWPHLPEDFDDVEKYPSTAVTFSNKHYDPVLGHKLYNRYLDELEYAEELGFDGVALNEHHQNCYANIVSPNIIAGMLARRTKRIKLALIGNALAVREQPYRVAEEVAMLDVISGGRIISGHVRSTGYEYFNSGVNPADSRARFLEGHELVIRAWTEEGPFHFDGKFFSQRYVNLWPRPLQKPHPPIWIPGLGSPETIKWVAHPDRKYTYMAVFMPDKRIKQFFDLYREEAASHGYTAAPSQMGQVLPVFIAETDEEAERQAKEHIEWVFHKGLRVPPWLMFPPGYLTTENMGRLMGMMDELDWSNMSFERLLELGYCVVGSPRTVRERLSHTIRDLGFGNLVTLHHMGTMSHEATKRNMEYYARDVMPYLREEFSENQQLPKDASELIPEKNTPTYKGGK